MLGRRGSLVVAASFLSTEANDSNGGEGQSSMARSGEGGLRGRRLFCSSENHQQMDRPRFWASLSCGFVLFPPSLWSTKVYVNLCPYPLSSLIDYLYSFNHA
ncbi:hypothetical protein MUK42_31203 [Musa troglodytarum]|uniref:Uncharacterized protein n=1 Tax=Musa troglodytarum TaxID=320322 RepID=A0A9E7JXQ4_9LILI|nr:hypothetical protein MUK42_31203 [Musa troglodytarum]